MHAWPFYRILICHSSVDVLFTHLTINRSISEKVTYDKLNVFDFCGKDKVVVNRVDEKLDKIRMMNVVIKCR